MSEVIVVNCEIDYCIHNKNLKCQYENISINGYGMCDECMIVSINEDELEEMKEKQLNNLPERTKDR